MESALMSFNIKQTAADDISAVKHKQTKWTTDASETLDEFSENILNEKANH